MQNEAGKLINQHGFVWWSWHFIYTRTCNTVIVIISLTGWEAGEVHRPVQILQLHSGLRLWVRKPSLVLMSWDLCRNLHVSSGVSVGRAAWWHTSGCACRFPSVTRRRWAWHGWTRVCSESCSASLTLSRSAATRVSSCCCRRSASRVTLIRRSRSRASHEWWLLLHFCSLVFTALCFFFTFQKPTPKL